MSILISQFIPHPASSLVSIHLFFVSMSLFLLTNKIIFTIFFSRFHIYVLIIYNSCFSLSDLLYSLWQSLGPSMTLQKTNSVIFYGRVMYHIFFIHSSVDGHLSCFHILVTVNSAPVNTGVHVSFWIMVFSGYIPRSKIAG